MDINTELTYKLLKYFGQGTLIYFLFKYVPKEPMHDRDILLITLIVILAYAVFENISLLYEKENSRSLSSTQCNTQCVIKEELCNLPKTIEHMSGSNNLVNNTNKLLPPIQQTVQQPVQQPVQQLVQQPVQQLVQQPVQQSLQQTMQQQVNSHSNVNSEISQISQISQMPQITQKGIKRNDDGSYTIVPVKNSQYAHNSTRAEEDVMGSEMAYNYTDYNSLPVSTTLDNWENGSSYLPPAQWFPVPPHPPVCVTEKVCPVCPTFTNGTDVSLKEWNQSRRISPPDNINVQYIQDKLNSGR